MKRIVLEEEKNWHYTLKEYIESIKEYGYIDCNEFDYEYWYILEQLEKLERLENEKD